MGEIAPSDERVHLASTTKDGRDKEEDEVKISLIAVLQKEVGCRLQQTKAVKVAVANGDLLEVNAWCKGLCWIALGEFRLNTDFIGLGLSLQSVSRALSETIVVFSVKRIKTIQEGQKSCYMRAAAARMLRTSGFLSLPAAPKTCY
ncbi:hypothetical protein Tco_0470822 [Tanacetum coccineum]